MPPRIKGRPCLLKPRRTFPSQVVVSHAFTRWPGVAFFGVFYFRAFSVGRGARAGAAAASRLQPAGRSLFGAGACLSVSAASVLTRSRRRAPRQPIVSGYWAV